MLPFINIQLVLILFADLIVASQVHTSYTITPILSRISLIIPLAAASLLDIKAGLVIFLVLRHLRFDGFIFCR